MNPVKVTGIGLSILAVWMQFAIKPHQVWINDSASVQLSFYSHAKACASCGIFAESV
jgi:hypothetical protein